MPGALGGSLVIALLRNQAESVTVRAFSPMLKEATVIKSLVVGGSTNRNHSMSEWTLPRMAVWQFSATFRNSATFL